MHENSWRAKKGGGLVSDRGREFLVVLKLAS